MVAVGARQPGEAAGRVAAGEREFHLVDDEGGEAPVSVGERRLERVPASSDEPLEGTDAGVRAVERTWRARGGRRRARCWDGGQEHAAPPWHAPRQGMFGVSASLGVGAVRLPSTAVGQLRHLSARSSVFSRENKAAHDVKPESDTAHAKSQHLRHLLLIPVHPRVDPESSIIIKPGRPGARLRPPGLARGPAVGREQRAGEGAGRVWVTWEDR